MGGINKTLTTIGNIGILSLTVNPQASMEVVGIEIRPSEHWVGGSTVPLRAFRLFNLPHDSLSYTGRERGDLVDRCLSRTGQVNLVSYLLL